MEGSRRVYPAERSGRGLFSYLLLFLSAVVIMSGIVWRNDTDGIHIEAIPEATAIPLDEAFDETIEERELSLPAATWFALQLGAFENEQAAHEMAEQFMRRGAAGYVWEDGRYRTLAALYSNKEDAQRIREQLELKHAIESYLYQIDLPAVGLRVRGMRGQLEILEAAFVHSHDLIVQLQEAGVSMDRQEMNAEEVRQELASLQEQIRLVSLRMKQRFTSPRHPVVDGMLACLDDYIEFCSTMDTEESAVQLGMRIKKQTLHSLRMLKDIYDMFLDT